MGTDALPYVFRMVHVQNMPHVLSSGLVHRSSVHASANYKAIGDRALIAKRRTLRVAVEGTGEVITLGDYIPFYFGTRSPMLYVMQQGGNFVPEPVQPEAIVYCVVGLDTLVHQKVDFYFSDGHATDSFTKFYDRSRVHALPQLVNLPATKARYWADKSNLDLKRKKQAELLVKGNVPVALIAGFVVCAQKTKEILVNLGCLEGKIAVMPSYYF